MMRSSSPRPMPTRHGGAAAFTLIELLVVMAIILVLAALILNTAGYVQYKASLSRAQGEVKHIATALESYKVDNGGYPQSNPRANPPETQTNDIKPLLAETASSTDAIINPAKAGNLYINSSIFLFQKLSGYISANNYAKSYITFVPGQLSTASATPGDSTYLIDPFGLSYGYSTAQAKAEQDNALSDSSDPVTAVGYNSTYDLWSTGGYSSPGGRNYPSSIAASKKYTDVWVKNW